MKFYAYLLSFRTKNMPSYKLSYFGIPGRGEIARFLFHYGGIKFEDHRFGFEEWPAIKGSKYLKVFRTTFNMYAVYVFLKIIKTLIYSKY